MPLVNEVISLILKCRALRGNPRSSRSLSLFCAQAVSTTTADAAASRVMYDRFYRLTRCKERREGEVDVESCEKKLFRCFLCLDFTWPVAN